eukprot:CAMPEP_0172660590 /NCGR_PEP_ID=MMETSP1074-20121228/4147_1 /TAXON_ID=2916 /ORGANISM="Ceratium fusus, Strain PA161109" /LENGTH=78 /DNA_ID=CAMNT_0013476221 /DNA_START=1573 /DNA_END=1809 /DNA_ORIENTATION=+
MDISKRLRTKLKRTSTTESTRIAQGSVDAATQKPSATRPCGRSTSCAVETLSKNNAMKQTSCYREEKWKNWYQSRSKV